MLRLREGGKDLVVTKQMEIGGRQGSEVPRRDRYPSVITVIDQVTGINAQPAAGIPSFIETRAT